MTTIVYIETDLNAISNDQPFATLERVHQDAVIKTVEVHDNIELPKQVEAGLPQGYSLVHPDETEYEQQGEFICVPVQIEYGSVQEFKKDAHDLHEDDTNYFNKWLLCCFLSDNLPFDAAARIEGWFAEE
ncbi:MULTISPECIES: hypothetical protein [Lactobacillus]|uniref:hypothetical protein n=1 Tax=Lactobacillus TaxID=1578 RepID=UPI000CD84905|nr:MULTISPECIES: hypothetical protein [Lactobacillus]RVU71908.1 hypothetical protein EJK20_11310 [Lactobacillus xujianguonis]